MNSNNTNGARLEKERIEMLKRRYSHVKKGAEQLNKDEIEIYLKTNDKPKNQGKCFYNFESDTYYVGVYKGKESNDRIKLELERENTDTGHTKVTFFMTGKTTNKNTNIKLISYIAPLNDNKKRKIKACTNHSKETGTRLFWNITASEDGISKEIKEDRLADYFIFDITGNKAKFIQFDATFNCHSVCQKVHFSDKRENLSLHAVLTGPNAKTIQTSILINCQNSPGRGAKAVITTQKNPQTIASFTKQKAHDGFNDRIKVEINLTLELDQNLEWSRLFDTQKYIDKLGTDLYQHAKILMARDVHNFDEISRKQIDQIIDNHPIIQYSPQNEATKEWTNRMNKDEKPRMNKDIRNIAIKIAIPKNIIQALGEHRAQQLIREIQEEAEERANRRLDFEVSKELERKNATETENTQLKAALNMANRQLDRLHFENRQLKLYHGNNLALD